jgi:zinc and cadmium transporter
MTTAGFILIAAIAIMIASLAGVISIHATIGRAVDAKLPYLVSFAAGVLLLSAVYLSIEAVHTLGSLWYALPLVLIGYAAVALMDYLWPQFHHHHDADCTVNHTSGRRVLIGDGIHNIADGLVLVPAFLASPLVGLGVAISILAHEFVQEVSEFFVLKKAGYSTTAALGLNFLVSSSILIGVVIGLLLTDTVYLQGVLLALSAGYFINIVFNDLLPHRHTELSRHNAPIHIGMIIIGMLAITGINQAFEHSHDHGATHGDAHAHETHNEHADHADHEENEDHNHETHNKQAAQNQDLAEHTNKEDHDTHTDSAHEHHREPHDEHTSSSTHHHLDQQMLQ